jgi:putative effector of murein hydrolase
VPSAGEHAFGLATATKFKLKHGDMSSVNLNILFLTKNTVAGAPTVIALLK